MIFVRFTSRKDITAFLFVHALDPHVEANFYSVTTTLDAANDRLIPLVCHQTPVMQPRWTATPNAVRWRAESLFFSIFVEVFRRAVDTGNFEFSAA